MHDTLESLARRAEIRDALLDLPMELLPAFYALEASGGSVTGMSRTLGQSRKSSGQRLEAIRDHFRKVLTA